MKTRTIARTTLEYQRTIRVAGKPGRRLSGRAKRAQSA